MLNRLFSLVLLVYLAAVSTAYGQGTTNNQGQSYLLQIPGATVSNGTFIGFLENANPLNSFITTTGPVGPLPCDCQAGWVQILSDRNRRGPIHRRRLRDRPPYR